MSNRASLCYLLDISNTQDSHLKFRSTFNGVVFIVSVQDPVWIFYTHIYFSQKPYWTVYSSLMFVMEPLWRSQGFNCMRMTLVSGIFFISRVYGVLSLIFRFGSYGHHMHKIRYYDAWYLLLLLFMIAWFIHVFCLYTWKYNAFHITKKQ